MESMAYETYIALIKHLCEAYSITFKTEQKYVHEIYEGEIPLFKLMYGYDEKRNINVVLVSFQLDLAILDAIQWWTRIVKTYGTARLMDSYFKDDRGETFLGQSAEVLRMYKIEQRVLENWAGDKEDAKKFAKEKIYGRGKARPKKAFVDKDAAVKEFYDMNNGEGDESH